MSGFLSSISSGITDVAGAFAGIPGAGSLFNGIMSLFGDDRRKLTQADWNQYFPGSGYWTTRIRNYLSAQIGYDVDLKNVEPFTKNFVAANIMEITNNTYVSTTDANFMRVVNNFYKMLAKEQQGESVPNMFALDEVKREIQKDSETKIVSIPTNVWLYVGGAAALLLFVPKLLKK